MVAWVVQVRLRPELSLRPGRAPRGEGRSQEDSRPQVLSGLPGILLFFCWSSVSRTRPALVGARYPTLGWAGSSWLLELESSLWPQTHPLWVPRAQRPRAKSLLSRAQGGGRLPGRGRNLSLISRSVGRGTLFN